MGQRQIARGGFDWETATGGRRSFVSSPSSEAGGLCVCDLVFVRVVAARAQASSSEGAGSSDRQGGQ